MLTVSDKTNAYARQVTDRLKQAGIRAELNDSGDKIGAKVRTALMAKVPFLLTVGEKEAETGTLSVRPYHDVTTGTLRGTMSVDEFTAGCVEKIQSRWHPTI
ncbi:MAG: His/Gly/Thr/Pro-type tRNA ligase C-terminal domain-containing protein [Tepidisphaeraceae bacterium]